VQSATASTSPAEGDASEGNTLGEIQILLQQANDRIQASSPFYKQYWQDIGEKFAAIVNANSEMLEDTTLYKKSQSGKYWQKNLKASEMSSKKGYKCKVSSKADTEADSLKTINKLQTASAEFAGNIPFQAIFQKRMLDWVGLSPEEEKEVLDFEAQHPQPLLPNPSPGGPGGEPPTLGKPPMQIPQKQPQQIPQRQPQPVAA
jgi:hypothetical protein